MPAARGHHAVNAAWLADASLLTYVPDTGIVTGALERAGLHEVTHFDRGGTYAFAASGRGAMIVALRGTRHLSVDDWKTDLEFLLAPSGGEGQVHRGFLKALDHIWPELRDHLAQALEDRALWLTGHSLGAALATLAAARLPEVHALYTFGSPRVGDRDFRKEFSVPALRFVIRNDPVSRLPPPILYRHVGRLMYFDRHGELRREPAGWERTLDRIAGAGDLETLPVRALADHSPLIYAIYARDQLR